MRKVNFLDLKAQYPLIRADIETKFRDIIDRSGFVSSKYVAEFEQAFAAYCGVKYCVAVSNGTNALQCALIAAGISRDDEVIIPVNTFIATAEAISLVGAKPVFVDIQSDNSYLIDPQKIRDAITPKTKAIIPVHLYGQSADMDPILSVARQYGLEVIEDACQAHGALYNGKRVGSMGLCGAFSFYPGKNLGAWGEGGAIVTNDESLAEKMRLLRDHGSPKKYSHDIVGGNYRMSEFQGAVLTVKLRHLDDWNEARRKNAGFYCRELSDIRGVTLPYTLLQNQSVWHLFVIRHYARERLMDYLKERGVYTGIHYPTPLHMTSAYADLGFRPGDFPIAESHQRDILSLPMYAELTEDDMMYVVEMIKTFT